jgi:hypothetical protein
MTSVKKTDSPVLQKGVKITSNTNLETKILVIRKIEFGEKRELILYVIM